ncbi:hypothetical protein AB0756_24710 [Tolypothrix campylonemoides VB511288_2]|uniref:Lipase family protein n=3 Tax=Nostocales TaxID=1161 RepID=A0A8S9TCD9_9CYAN|nr:lipase family protein [Tolypothrix bouteillei]KAF3889264.1 lipase family protein [Tolypothrix bouteillei VB521301]
MLNPFSNFELNVAIELGYLVDAAYNQFNAKKQKQVWTPEVSGVLKIDDENEYKILATYEIHEPYNFLDILDRDIVPFGFIAAKANNIYIVFRGTENPLEWFRDGEIRQVPYLENWGKVSFGSQKIYQTISSKILETLNDPNKCAPGSKIFVTGHSLGGSLASLCVPDIITHTSFQQPILYTFASPRTGDPTFAQTFKTSHIECYRIANSEDIVPNFPVSTLDLPAKKISFLNKFVAFQVTKTQERITTTSSSIKSVQTQPVQKNLEVKVETTRGLMSDLNMFKYNDTFEHIGIPIYFTVQKNSIANNHDLKGTYIQALTQDLKVY